MKKVTKYLIFVILLFTVECFAQKSTLTIHPAFHNKSQLKVVCKTDSCLITFNMYESKDSSNILSSDTINVDNENFSWIFSLKGNNYSQYKDFILIDGLKIYGLNEVNNQKHNFEFWLGSKSKKETELLQANLRTLRKETKDRNIKKYLRIVRKYLR